MQPTINTPQQPLKIAEYNLSCALSNMFSNNKFSFNAYGLTKAFNKTQSRVAFIKFWYYLRTTKAFIRAQGKIMVLISDKNMIYCPWVL
jgi:hypothetical protein